MLQINLSDSEIQQLNYERYRYPCPVIQKRIHAVYLKSFTEHPPMSSAVARIETMTGTLPGYVH